MSNLIPELTVDDRGEEEILGTPEPPPPPPPQPSILIPYCMGCCSGISSFVLLAVCIIFTFFVVFARRGPDALSTTYTPNAVDAARYETAVALAVQDAESESRFDLRYSQEEFGSWLHRNNDTLLEQDVLDLLLITEIGELRTRYSFNDWFFQVQFLDTNRMLIYGETSVFERLVRLTILIDATVQPVACPKPGTGIPTPNPRTPVATSTPISPLTNPSNLPKPLIVNVTSVQIGDLTIENTATGNEEPEFIYRIERDLEDVLLALLSIKNPYCIDVIKVEDRRLVITGFVPPVFTVTTPIPLPTSTNTPTVQPPTRTPTEFVTPTEEITLAPTPDQFLPTAAVTETATEAPAE